MCKYLILSVVIIIIISVVILGFIFKINLKVIFVSDICESVFVISDCFWIIKKIFKRGVIIVIIIDVWKVFCINL